MIDQTTSWLKSGEYLPDFMRDFHDQKDVFKACDEVMQRSVEKNGGSYMRDLSWADAHVYTVDIFLWMMARHGYTLQRSRKRVPFSDLCEWLTGAKTRRNRQMAGIFGLTPIAPVAPKAGTPDAELGPGSAS
jgi:hypothetical protein